ncbi:hypothetical protein IWW55_000051 [Coemansia sp. RSA 2706]|nr:hypothetical protein LPJ63_000457 [Coemansia sp. RSA 2711]KAJ2308960.1 hypothetical protein IWW55_000051 [Coemansia sp. RSA 2706]KAJ2315742.1 hypothetical protein IWW54_000111 [Coemansia sp. RSA 2705]KAJ2322397.1 hypothetical protein IWW52_000045 [Coemansia sp. RSA 2704]KAJ2739945.1 hypothetical protein H4R23_000043 [Coemansia sp. Cherry 401B]
MFDALPADIVYRVMRIATSDNHKNLIQWRRSLPLLAVCRHWRATAKGVIYACAHVINSTANEKYKHLVDRSLLTEGPACLAKWSNILLILYNADCRNVKRLQICTLESKYYLSPLLCILYLLFLDNPDYPEVELLESAAHKMQQRQHIGADHKCDLYLAAANIGSMVACVFPNVTQLVVSAIHANRTLISFFITLTERYIGQLTLLEYRVPKYFPIPWAAPKLRNLHICLSGHGPKPPLIDPRNIRVIILSVTMVDFQWDWFHWDKATKTIIFDNLCSLYLTGEMSFSLLDKFSRQLDNKNDLLLQFPKLKRIFIRNGYFSKQTITQAINCGLSFLEYRGFSKDAREICKLDVGRLEVMMFWFNLQELEEFDDEFFDNMNYISHRVRDVKSVYCTVTANFILLDLSRVHWQFITHLSLGNAIDLDTLVPLLPCIPNVVHLILTLDLVDEPSMEVARNVIMNMPRDHPDPPLTKLEIWHIKHKTLDCTKYFTDALPVVTAFFSTLKSFVLDNQTHDIR